MILEQALLYVKKGEATNFEKDFATASQYISHIEGYIRHSLHKCMEVENKYLLLVHWKDIESHEVNFRTSEEYQHWKKLLHHYYEPFPIVEHYEIIFKNEGS
ncbi:antibiotic biosynthesis monooxygenase [Aquimarina sp. ERC-38]|uniref:antibiotic biosynthesis monooxygenase family protein n=1 Tax=Aquimarina sp. ERC-38 TaxID=2949996 RepID=UPI00224660E9|nr:antibiotic biosynthesis monooxygenase [Aquimarina sp. ERC-38]UZO80000.1 antibiotic biosynthesis monooxygenase [Aquimarina sp. ERC-38]